MGGNLCGQHLSTSLHKKTGGSGEQNHAENSAGLLGDSTPEGHPGHHPPCSRQEKHNRGLSQQDGAEPHRVETSTTSSREPDLQSKFKP